jgi:NADH dehydrogenase/NADH:ubiquinone oxidoreductase subunit G
MGEIPLTINGRACAGREGMTILEAARSLDIDIPTLCHHDKLAPFGACRLCVVEVEGSRPLVGSCHTPIRPDMVVQTHSPRVLATRRVILELLLASHGGDCLVCDKANLCELRAYAADLEVGLPAFQLPRHYYSPEDDGRYIHRDLSKCIMCRRCVRACREIAGHNILGTAYRGFEAKIIVDSDIPLNKDICRDCDECVTVCPTGALSKPRRLGQEKQGKPLTISGR